MSPITRAQKMRNQNRASSLNSSSSSFSLLLSLPEDLLMLCIARVSKHKYRNLSRVCKLFRSIVTSPDLFVKRSLLKCTEFCIYVQIRNYKDDKFVWHTLISNEDGEDKKLVPVTSLPPPPLRGKSYVATGSKIFVVSGYDDKKSDVSVIDCRFDISRSIGKMPELVSRPNVSAVVDGKIYVIGCHPLKNMNTKQPLKRMLMLDTESETWEYDTRSGLVDERWVFGSVAIEGKLYVSGAEKSHVFDTEEGKWEELLKTEDDGVVSLRSIWRGYIGCVVDEILYTFDMENRVFNAYDLKQRFYRGVVKGGVEGLLDEEEIVRGGAVSCCGEKKMMLMLLLQDGGIGDDRFRIWCGEITLTEKRETGEIWGNVEWNQVVHQGDAVFSNLLTVTV